MLKLGTYSILVCLQWGRLNAWVIFIFFPRHVSRKVERHQHSDVGGQYYRQWLTCHITMLIPVLIFSSLFIIFFYLSMPPSKIFQPPLHSSLLTFTQLSMISTKINASFHQNPLNYVPGIVSKPRISTYLSKIPSLFSHLYSVLQQSRHCLKNCNICK